MTEKEVKKILTKCIAYLKTLPAGTKTSTYKILKDLGYDPEKLDLMDFHRSFYAEAREYDLVYVDPETRFSVMGLPYVIPFTVHNGTPVCPYCGSKHVASILYGMPAMTEQLQRDLKAKKVVIGGCIVTDIDPWYHCNKCRKDF